MGLKPKEVKGLYYKDFNLMLAGYQKRLDREWNQTRHIMWSVMNYGGAGLTEPVTPDVIWPLAMDAQDEKRMITTLSMAIELLKEFRAV